MIKKFLSILCIIFVTSFAFTAVMPSYQVSARIPSDLPQDEPGTEEDPGTEDDNSGEENNANNDCKNVLGLVPWDCGITITDSSTAANEDVLKHDILQIATNVLTDITIIASYLVLGYVFYGGYLYVFSGGDPGKVANGKRTLIHAFTGLAIVLLAENIMSTIRYILLKNNSEKFINCATQKCVNPSTAITRTINWTIGVISVVSVIFLIYGGISFITSSGDPGKIKKAKSTIFYSIIGLIVVGLAITITAFVTNIINNAK